MGFSNDFMVAAAGHPFLAQMVAALPTWNKRFGSKYPTVMFSTGPMFVSYQVSIQKSQPKGSCSGLVAHKAMPSGPHAELLPAAARLFSMSFPRPIVMAGQEPMPLMQRCPCSSQASHYKPQSELFVLPECLYGKYTPCEETLFKHYTGSTWHGSDASTLK